MTSSRNVSFRAPDGLRSQLLARDPKKGNQYPGSIAKREVERWYSLMVEGMQHAPQMSLGEAVVFIHYVATYDGRPSHSDVMDACEVLFDQDLSSMPVDQDLEDFQESLSRKLAGLREYGHVSYAMWDAAERYEVIAAHNEDPDLTFGRVLHQVGLHSYTLDQSELAQAERMGAVPGEFLPKVYLRTREVES